MKRTNLLLAVVLAFAVSSCQQEDTLGNYSSKEDAARKLASSKLTICKWRILVLQLTRI